jgi:acyl-CoA reductase-like NAD-dependent aldehyde dehydrogenase
LISRDAATRIGELVQDATAKGAHLVLGGSIDGSVMQPAVLDRVTSAMTIYSEESFGPVVAVLRASDEGDAIRLANDSRFGLSASVFTRNSSRGLRVAEQIQSGICHVNGPTVHDEPNMPFGGVKDSGYGRFGGRAAIAEFTDLRWISVQTGPRNYPF